MSFSLSSYRLDWASAGPLTPGLEDLAAKFPESASAKLVVFQEQAEPGYRMEAKGESVQIHYQKPCDAFRALGGLLAGEETGGERRAFVTAGVMLDASRNGVFRPAALKDLFRRFALMGINAAQLYLEDVYEIPGEPFFGYARGRYTAEELKEIDRAAERFGIEVIPCIQTLAHLEQILQWPAYAALADMPAVMLAGEPKTYELIGKMLDTVAGCFRSRRVHIGMDEAFGIGLGRYRQKHGDRRAFDILNGHLQRVVELCRERGQRPMIWSDMYFRLGSADGDYYDKAATIPPEIAAGIPAEVDLVYWDYYHTEPEFYREWIDRHRALGKEPIFAAGGWTWNRLWTALPYAFTTVSAGLAAAREKGVSEVWLTLWGDDGTECNPGSMLPAVQHFAELTYSEKAVPERLARRLAVSGQTDFDSYVRACELDAIPGIGPIPKCCANFGKWILWHDPALGFLEKHIPAGLPEHYRKLAADLTERNRSNDPHLTFASKLCEALEHKSHLHLTLRAAYRDRDFARLQDLAENTLPATVLTMEELRLLHQQAWNLFYKAPGWDVIERRYFGIQGRLSSLHTSLLGLLKAPETRLEELEIEPQLIHPEKDWHWLLISHARASSASAIH